jgi:hypothetical protein
MPWAQLSSAGAQSALPQSFSPFVIKTRPDSGTPRRSAVMGQWLVVNAAELSIDVRKQYVHKTRVNAGGDGASGPHPEREPA